jgi:hypothetical protein
MDAAILDTASTTAAVDTRAAVSALPLTAGRRGSSAVVDLGPFPLARTGLRPAGAFFADPEGRAGFPGAGCGDSVGILKITADACVIFTSSLPAFPQTGGLTLAFGRAPDRDSNAGPTA